MGAEGQILNEKEVTLRRRATYVSLFVGIILLILKFWAHNLTESQAIFSDAVESIVNVLAALMGVWVIWYSAKPKDEDHPYGHGKSEYFSSAFEGGLVTFASMMIIIEAIHSLYRGEHLQQLNMGLMITGGAGLANLLLGLYLLNRAEKFKSIALKAAGQHVISDSWTSAAVIVGLFLVSVTGWNWIDATMALLVGVWLAWVGFKLVRESIGGLMDQQDQETLAEIAKVLTDAVKPGIIQIHHVRVIRSGWYHHIDAHMVMPEFWDVLKTHTVINNFEHDVIERYAYSGEMNFHVDPCRKAYCEVCELTDCPIRRAEFKESLPILMEHLTSPVEPQQFRKRRG